MWRPALLLAWRRHSGQEWDCLLRIMHARGQVVVRWVIHRPEWVLPVLVDEDPMTWWMPATPDDGPF